MQPKQSGFSVIEVVIALVIFGVIGLAVWRVMAKQAPPLNSVTQTSTPTCKYDSQTIKVPRKSATNAFTASLTNPDDISVVTPGLGDARFVYMQINPKGTRIPVYAPADGTLVIIVYKHRTDLSAAEAIPDYDISFMVSCNAVYRINHITDPIPAIAALRPVDHPLVVGGLNYVPPTPDQTKPKSFKYMVKAGQQIGTTTGTAGASNWDFGLFINSQATCPYSYFVEPLQSMWLAKLGNNTTPIPGTICKVSGSA